MKGDRDLSLLTERLQDEAQRLTDLYPSRAPDAAHWARLTRHRRQRRLMATAGLLLAAGAAVWTVTATRNQQIPAVVAKQSARTAEPVPVPPTSSPSALPVKRLTLVLPPERHAIGCLPRLGWEIVLRAPDGRGGSKPVATGYYLPQQVQSVRFEDLSPTQRYAVGQLLRAEGLETQGPEI